MLSPSSTCVSRAARTPRRTRTALTTSSPLSGIPRHLHLNGADLWIVTGKGVGTGPNSAMETTPPRGNKPQHPYIASMIWGSVTHVNLKDAQRDHEALTAEVLRSNRMEGRTNQITFATGSNPIRHVIYIMKENRTYDQVFGDIKEANGDPSLVMYGEDITPNQHKLARQFGSTRQLLRQRGSLGRRSPLVTRRHHHRLQRERLAHRLSRRRARVRLRGYGWRLTPLGRRHS